VTRVAYLFGVSGSGKGHIAEGLEKDVQVIPGDRLRDEAARRLCPEGGGPSDPWKRWDYYLRTFDVPPTFSAILGERRPRLSNNRPILAEGFNLGHDDWREALRAALTARGIAITAERIFWIDPPAKVIWENRRRRGRKAQSKESLETVRQHRGCYHQWVSHHVSCRYHDAEEAIRAIREFLLP
jgi:predicted kinase